MANDDDFKARLARLAALGSQSVASGPAVCPACSGSGWAVYEGTAYACLCADGQKKPATVKTLRDVASEHALRTLFPDGIPREIIGWSIRLEACGVGRAESRYTFETFAARFKDDKVNERHLRIAQLWIETEPAKRSDLVLFGSHGRGKTGLAVAIARALVERKTAGSIHFTEAEHIAQRIRSTYRRGGDDGRYEPGERTSESEADVQHALVDVGTLIIDEVTGVKITEFVDDKLRAIVTARQRAERPTLLTLNVDAALSQDAAGVEAALARILGPALYDRLAERAQFLAMFGSSTRGTQRR